MFNAIDLHGAKIHVVRSTCASYVGVHGIVVQELPDTIVVVQENGKTVQLRKKVVDFLIEDETYIVGKSRNQQSRVLKRWDLNM